MNRRLPALLLLLLLLPACAMGEMLDLSMFEGGEPPAAETWEDAVFETRPWYEREDGSDWRYQDDGSVIVTISATGDVTIGGDRRKSGKNVFDKQLELEPNGLDFQFRRHADDDQEQDEEFLLLCRAAGVCAGAHLWQCGSGLAGE